PGASDRPSPVMKDGPRARSAVGPSFMFRDRFARVVVLARPESSSLRTTRARPPRTIGGSLSGETRDLMIDTFSIELPWDLCAAKVARFALVDWGANPESDVAVSELVLNAFQHGAPPITLTAIRTPDRVRIEICDG